jgi:hypothetical protein
MGTTVKVSFPLTAMLLIDVVLNVKEVLLVPESPTVNDPVAWFPVLFTVTLWAISAG